MGWRDINMSRRKPPLRLAAIPVEEGDDLRQAVLRKASRSAGAELAGLPVFETRLAPFVAGFLAGVARHQALKHGVDAEVDEAGASMQALLAMLAEDAPPPLALELAKLRFAPRQGARSTRAGLSAGQGLADAGYLAGHLGSLCGSGRLLGEALRVLARGDVEAFLTACDIAADPMQTRQPLMSLRFDTAEREVLRRSLSGLSPPAG